MYPKLLVLLLLSCSCFPALAQSRGGVSGPMVRTDRWPRTTNLAEWTRDVMRLEGVEQASETERGKVFFRWLRLFNRMATGGMIQAYEGSTARSATFSTPTSNCSFTAGATATPPAASPKPPGRNTPAIRHRPSASSCSTKTAAITRCIACASTAIGAPSIRATATTSIDHDAPDARVLDWADIGDDENIRKNQTYRNRSQPFFEFFGLEWERAFLINPRYYADEPSWIAAGKPVECVFGNGQYKPGTPFHDMDFRLAPGMKIERYWDNSARKFYVPAARVHQERRSLPARRTLLSRHRDDESTATGRNTIPTIKRPSRILRPSQATRAITDRSPAAKPSASPGAGLPISPT